jgi:hypothetical protein
MSADLLVVGSRIWLWVDFGDAQINGGSASRDLEMLITEVSSTEPFAVGTATSHGENFGHCTVRLVPPPSSPVLARVRGRQFVGAGRPAIGTFTVGEPGDCPGLIFPFVGESALVAISAPRYRPMPPKRGSVPA